MTPRTLPALLAERVAEHPRRDAVISDEDRVTYDELERRSRDVAAALVGMGVDRRSRVGLLMPDGVDWVVNAVAVLRVGAVLVPLSTLLRPPELAAQLRTAGVAHLVVAPRIRRRRPLEDLADISPELPDLGRSGGPRRLAELPSLCTVVPTTVLSTVHRAPDEVVAGLEGTVSPGDDMCILFTSGSSGAPKGVIHTHANALTAVGLGLDARRIGPGDRLYIPMPFFWTGGFAGGVVSALLAGATLLSEADPEPARTIAFLERERATLFRGWPDQAAAVAADPAFATADLSALKPGSLDAVLPAHLRAAPGRRANLFGMTETFGPYCGTRLDTELPAAAAGACGRPFAGVDVRIVDPSDGTPHPDGAVGEIQVRGPNLMRGIVGRRRRDVFTRDGYYPTGDLGRFDENGYLHYAGRIDDMFKVAGATVYPSEVEAALRMLPGVLRAHVTDVETANGPRVGAAVVISDETGVEDLVAGLRQRLSAFKIPARWALLTAAGDIPLLASGKVDVPALRELILGATEGRTHTDRDNGHF